MQLALFSRENGFIATSGLHCEGKAGPLLSVRRLSLEMGLEKGFPGRSSSLGSRAEDQRDVSMASWGKGLGQICLWKAAAPKRPPSSVLDCRPSGMQAITLTHSIA